MKVSVDKCSGEDCACVIAAGFRKLEIHIRGVDTKMFIGPPGAPPPMGMLIRRHERERMRNGPYDR